VIVTRVYCARCGDVPGVEWWRDKLFVCDGCWCALNEWALSIEHNVRVMVERNDQIRKMMDGVARMKAR
jgi:hypothetical protein